MQANRYFYWRQLRDMKGSAEVETMPPEPLSLDALRSTAARLPADVYRAKGIVQAAEVAGKPVILQVVGRRVDLSAGQAWNGERPRTRIVAIGTHGATVAAGMKALFDPCIASFRC